ncbi:hypothetical protein [Panacagrimonas perspica]|uniref:hypothetical protein n=1 Tax=Panacagrimonas perspica TaxID=381431 RepID=UPI0013C35778|nr:hypothetical protein [Panacagrimonas perspica]
MSVPTGRQPRSSDALFLVLIVPVAILVAAAMIRVVSEFGFTALGEPAVIELPGH